MRVNVNLNEDLLTKVDEVAKKLNISRSAFISVCCSSAMNVYYKQIDTERLIQKAVDEMQEIEADAIIRAQFLEEE